MLDRGGLHDRAVWEDALSYRVNTLYRTIQGEGVRAGTPIALIRLQGCGVGCPWCDTRETWALDRAFRVDTLAQAIAWGPGWTVARSETIARAARDLGAGLRWALITGGEPAEQGLGYLVEDLHAQGFAVQLETSGTRPIPDAWEIDHLTVSPKVEMPGGRPVLLDVLRAADEIKFVVGSERDLQKLAFLLQTSRIDPRATPVLVQPLSQRASALALCVEACYTHGYRLSPQVHKYLNLP